MATNIAIQLRCSNDAIPLSKGFHQIDIEMNSLLRLPPPRKTTGGGAWGGFRKFFGFGPKEESIPTNDYYTQEVSGYTGHCSSDLFLSRMKTIINHPFVVLLNKNNNRCLCGQDALMKIQI